MFQRMLGIMCAIVVTAQLTAMEPQGKSLVPLTELDEQLLLHAGYPSETYDRIVKNGLTAQDKELLQALRHSYQITRKQMNDYGYDYIFNGERFIARWRPLELNNILKSALARCWNFNSDDMEQLTLISFDQPDNDPRIQMAGLTLNNFSLFGSFLLWPNGPREADILILLPRILHRQPEDINQPCIGGLTLLAYLIKHNYHRAAEILLQDSRVDVNAHPHDTPHPLEHALRCGHSIIAKLILAKPNVSVTRNMLTLTEDRELKILIQKKLEQAEAPHNVLIFPSESSHDDLPFVPSNPDNTLRKDAQKKLPLIGDAEPRRIPAKKWSSCARWTTMGTLAAIVGVAVKYAMNYYDAPKKDTAPGPKPVKIGSSGRGPRK